MQSLAPVSTRKFASYSAPGPFMVSSFTVTRVRPVAFRLPSELAHPTGRRGLPSKRSLGRSGLGTRTSLLTQAPSEEQSSTPAGRSFHPIGSR
jgi:hypothetical protein